jgi:glycosyltransferase involved in cell wall biosynthesis
MASALLPHSISSQDGIANAGLLGLKVWKRELLSDEKPTEKPMKICFIIHNITARAGSERAQANLANALSARGKSISIWSMYGAGLSPGFPLTSGVKVSYGLKTPLLYFLDYPWLACVFAIHVIRQRPDWIVCTGANRLIVALMAAFVPGVKVVIWEHFPVTDSVTKARGRLARKIASVVASRIVTLTKSDKDLYATLYAATGRVTHIPNIVLSPGVTGRARHREVLAMGRLSREKGFDLLLEAWALAIPRLPDWSLRIVGDGQMRDELVRRAGSLGIENHVTFAPFSDDPFSLYSECGIFVLSSRFEGLPFVLIEAMTCGTACISFDCPNGPREVIRNGVNGLLVSAEQVNALASAIVKLGENPMLRQRLGYEARKVSKPFSEPRVVARWQEVLYGQMPIVAKSVAAAAPGHAAGSRAA